MNPASTGGTKRAFTLIELLVVAAIIGLLVALLLPALSALSAAKHHGWDARCVSNLRQLSVASVVYMDEAGKTISASRTNNLASWVGCLRPCGVTGNLLLCPATRAPERPPSPDAQDPGTASAPWCAWPPGIASAIRGSYSVNGWLLSFDPSITMNSGWVSPPPPEVRSDPQFVFVGPSSISRPSQIPLFADSVWWNEWPLDFDPPARDLSKGESLDIAGMQRCTIWRHGGKTATSPVILEHNLGGWHIPVAPAINVGFVDGHARMVRVKDLWSLYWHDQWKATGPPH